MPTVADLLDRLELEMPSSKAAGWDRVGLQVGDRADPANRVAVCHEATTAVVSRLETDPVDLLISYHPLLFRPAVSFVAGASAAGRAFRLARAGIALAVVHTAFDVAPGGAADALAAAIGLDETRGFGPLWVDDQVKIVVTVPANAVDEVTEAMAGAGAGEIGNYSWCSFRVHGTGTFLAPEQARPAVGDAGARNLVEEVRIEMVASAALRDRVVEVLVGAHPYEQPAFDVYPVAANAAMAGRVGVSRAGTLGRLAADVGAALDTEVRVAGPQESAISNVAVVPGSGSSFIEAAAVSADVLVTGDVGHHDARAALDRGLSIIDAGHAPTERPGIETLYAAVSGLVSEAEIIDLDPHPWEYV